MGEHLDHAVDCRIGVERDRVGVRVLHGQQHRAKRNKGSQHVGAFLVVLDRQFVHVGERFKLIELGVVQRVDAFTAGGHTHPQSVLECHAN